MNQQTELPPDLIDMADRWQQANTVANQWSAYRRQLEDLILAHHWVKGRDDGVVSAIDLGPLTIQIERQAVATDDILQSVRQILEQSQRRPRFTVKPPG